jgi:uncharacterized glyoxalase superfamily protein PhnB
MNTDDIEFAPLAVELFVDDVLAAVRWYEEALGYKPLRIERYPSSEQASFAIGTLENAVIMFMHDVFYAGARSDLDVRGSGVDIRIMVPNVDTMYELANQAGAKIVHDIGDREYGLRDFIMIDPFGFRLRFSSPLT